MTIITNYTPWQIEKAVTASLVELDLFNEKQMIEYTHWLLDREFYDDALLDIIDDDPLFPNPENNRKMQLKVALFSLGFPELSENQAKWIYTYMLLISLSVRPHDYNTLRSDFSDVYSWWFDNLAENDVLQDVSEITNIIYRLDDALDNAAMDYVWQGYNDPDTILTIQREFFQLCEDWLRRNETKIEKIFGELYR